VKLSRKIIQNMPTTSLKDIEAREAAHLKLTEAEQFVDKFEQLHTDVIAKDGVDSYDGSPMEGVVRHQTGVQGEENHFQASDILASDVNGTPHLTHKTSTLDRRLGYSYEVYDVKTEEVRMETNSEKGRTTFTVREVNRKLYGEIAKFEPVDVSERVTPSRTIIVEGTGEDRTYRFEPIGTLEAMWESLSGVAASIGRTLAPIKQFIPKIQFEVK